MIKIADDDFARLIRFSEDGGLGKASALTDAQGLLMSCPCKTGHALVLWFYNTGVPPHALPATRWIAQGESLSDLTLTPSVAPQCCHFWIRQGCVVSC
jgi:Family of unknown function (DUF6527)